MNYKKAGLVIIFALLATQVILNVKSYIKDQKSEADHSKLIESQKAESLTERDARTKAEKSAAESKSKIDLLTSEKAGLETRRLELKSHLDDMGKLVDELGLRNSSLNQKNQELQQAIARKDADLTASKLAEKKASNDSRDAEIKSKAREVNLLSQIDGLEKALEERSQRLEAAKRALNNSQNGK